MNAVAIKEIESQIVDRLGQVFARHEKQPVEMLASGISEIDQALAGFPRGAISEIYGAASCGRTSLLLATLAAATASEETCAVIDCSDTFDLSSAAQAGVNFDRLLWVRCNQNLEHAFKAVDLLLHGGGFGLVILNLADMPARTLRRIVSTWWFRFRRAIENTPAVLLVAAPVACARSCAAMALELKIQSVWMMPQRSADELREADPLRKRHLSLVTPEQRDPVVSHSHLLRGLTAHVNRQRPSTGLYPSINFTSFGAA
jgi:hypothetical protein